MSDTENKTVETTEAAPEEKQGRTKKEKPQKPQKPQKPDKKGKDKASDGEENQKPNDADKSKLKNVDENGKPIAVTDSSKYKYVIQNKKVRSYSKRRTAVIIVAIFLLLTILIGGTTYGIMLAIEVNNFRVLVDKEGEEILSLSIDDNFSAPTEVLAIDGPQFMDNISLEDFDEQIPDIVAAHGSASGDKYIAATFYLSNVSQKEQKYSEKILLSDVSKGVDEALRVLVIKGEDKMVYAKVKADGTPEEAVPGRHYTKSGDPHDEVWMAQPFSDDVYVINNTGIPIAINEVVKYTIIIWLEGWDEQCVNAILGGTIKLEFEFSRAK